MRIGGLVAPFGDDIGGLARLRRGQLNMARARLMALGDGHQEPAEQLARDALGDFAGAMNWLEDTPEFEVAHYRLDEAGRWVRETFGCWIKRDGSTYSRTCPADIAHVRVGLSPGMRNIVRQCSVCGQEPRACRHIKGREYETTRRLIDGQCTLCGSEACEHTDGQVGFAVCWHYIVSVDLVEISLVPRPAQPMARIREIEVETSTLKAVLGPNGWLPGMEVSCDKCLSTCRGAREYDPLRGADNLL
jgi:hypothetical protein